MDTMTPEPLSVDALLEQLDGDMDMLRVLADVFLQEGPAQLDAVAQALDRRNAAGLAASAHRIKGSIGVFGAPHAQRAALALEQAGQAGDLSTVDAPYQTLAATVAELIVLLETVQETAA